MAVRNFITNIELPMLKTHRNIIIIFTLMGFILIGCGGNLKKHKKDKVKSKSSTSGSDSPAFQMSEKGDSIFVAWQWIDYSMESYSIQFSISKEDILASKKNRLQLRLSPLVKNCPDYASLVKYDLAILKPFSQALKKLAKAHHLNERRTVEMVITMIQNIDYTLVHPLSHMEMEVVDKEAGGNFISEYHAESTHKPYDMMPFGGCDENVDPAGIYSPVEFLSSFRGDCDTRTVTVYTLLKLMNLQSIVVNGPGHSMLALPYSPNNPAAPSIKHGGQNFYFLETTVFFQNGEDFGPQIGDVPADFNPDQWFPVLI